MDRKGYIPSILVLAQSAYLAGCSLGPNYSGEGEFVKVGGWPFVNYEARFPRIDLAINGQHEYYVSGLPEMRTVVGLSVDTRKTEPCGELEYSLLGKAVVNLELIKNSGEVIVFKEAPLAEWVWSRSLGGPYRDEWSSEDCFIYSEDMYFKPDLESRYSLRVVVNNDSGKSYSVRAVIKTVGSSAP